MATWSAKSVDADVGFEALIAIYLNVSGAESRIISDVNPVCLFLAPSDGSGVRAALRTLPSTRLLGMAIAMGALPGPFLLPGQDQLSNLPQPLNLRIGFGLHPLDDDARMAVNLCAGINLAGIPEVPPGRAQNC